MNADDVKFLRSARKLPDQERYELFINLFPAADSMMAARAVKLFSRCSWKNKYKNKLLRHYGPSFHGLH